MKYEKVNDGIKFIPETDMDCYKIGIMMAQNGGDIQFQMPEHKLAYYIISFGTLLHTLTENIKI
jgi:hypothetical protein